MSEAQMGEHNLEKNAKPQEESSVSFHDVFKPHTAGKGHSEPQSNLKPATELDHKSQPLAWETNLEKAHKFIQHDLHPWSPAIQAKLDALPPLTDAEITRVPRSEETVPADETQVLRRVIDNAKDKYFTAANEHFQKDPDKPFTRDAHPDAQGTFLGVLTVPEGLPAEERVGTFATPGKHLVVVRASTGLFEGKPEFTPNAHAWAMKVFDVNEPNNMKGAKVHDIIETNYAPDHYPVFLFPNPQAYDTMNTEGPAKFLFPSMDPHSWNWKELDLTWDSLKTKIDGVAETRYGSQLPYAWGDKNDAKYLLEPVASTQIKESTWLSEVASRWTPHYLTDKLHKELQAGPITMKLSVQIRQAGEKVEDGTDEWKGKPEKVATIYIPPQDTKDANHIWLGENISMNPGRAPVEQKPVGAEGFLRSVLYNRQAELRKIFNGVERDADGMPKGWEERFAGTIEQMKPLLKN